MLQLVGLTVISVVADGGTCNRRFFRLHKIPQHLKSGVTYMTPNISFPGSNIFFMPDAPHLLKTVRNALYNSQANRTRNLVVKNIIILFVNVFTYTCLLPEQWLRNKMGSFGGAV